MFGRRNINVEYKGYRVEDVCTKIGRVVGGENGEKVGRTIDDFTKKITIKIPD